MRRWSASHGSRIIIEGVNPVIDCGRYPLKRIVGDTLELQADIFRDGHDLLVAVLKYRPQQQADWSEAPMRCVNPGLDLWTGSFPLTQVATYTYTIEAWVDAFATWRVELQKKAEAAQDVASELLEGMRLILSTAERVAGHGDVADFLTFAAERITKAGSQTEAVRLALDDQLATVMSAHPDRSQSSFLERELQVVVDRQRAQFAAWYEFFPRSQGPSAEKSGTFHDCIRRLPEIKQLGFEVVYLPPIHPIGQAHRKGKNNSLLAGPNDPGSPWGIGSAAGGHLSVEPSLGTLQDFDAFVQAARELDIDVALDFAIQCSPEHPFVKQHPEWFYHRPDGSIKYAENPPKKYQDIYPVNFDTDAWPSLWEEMRNIVRFWIGHGVRTFRVDNPHTKPIRFWEWLIAAIKREHPETIFLAEAFTRPKVMKTLAKAGFTQSYTYFTWRNAKAELVEYFTELTQTAMAELLSRQPLRQYAGHPARVLAARRAAGVRDPRVPGGDAVLGLRHLQRLRAVRKRAHPPGQRGVPRFREVRDQAPRLERHGEPARLPDDDQPHAPRQPRVATVQEPALPRLRQRTAHLLQQGNAGFQQRRDRRRQSRPAPLAGRLRAARSGRTRPGRRSRVRRARSAHGRTLALAWRHNYVKLEPQQEPAHLLVVRR